MTIAANASVPAVIRSPLNSAAAVELGSVRMMNQPVMLTWVKTIINMLCCALLWIHTIGTV